MGLRFEWDGATAEANDAKHGITFEEASTAFGDQFSLTRLDPEHADHEERFILIGRTIRDRLVVVVHVLRGENVRIISTRPATRSERRTDEEA
jgi:uncharacterized DUF497 family protein